MQIEFILLVLSLLFFASIFTDKIGYRFGVPALVLFLAIGMLFGTEGLSSWISSAAVLDHHRDVSMIQGLSTVALCIILFSGGLDTKISDIQPVLAPGITLATLGVLLTCIITGTIIYFIFGWLNAVASVSIWVAMLMAATMSSTDSASVFSILRTNGIKFKHNLRPLLELESGANDPMAYILTISLIGIVLSGGQNVSILALVQDVLVQLVMGAVMGVVFGKFIVWLMKTYQLNNESLYPIMVLAACIFIFSVTYYLKGNPYLAVYLGGLIIGNSKFIRKRQTKSFFDGLTWLSQLVMFLMLGLMIRPSELLHLEVWLPCLIISIVMIFISRPISVFLCLIPWRNRYRQNDKLMISWVGLRGAVPIIFAVLCEASGVPHADLILNVVFACTIVSLLAQGTTLSWMANKLGLADKQAEEKKLRYFDIDLPEEIAASAEEKEVTAQMLETGNKLMNLKNPKKKLVVMVRREETFFVPTGQTELQVGDHILLISENNAEQVVQELEDEKAEILTNTALNVIHNTGDLIKDQWTKLKDHTPFNPKN